MTNDHHPHRRSRRTVRHRRAPAAVAFWPRLGAWILLSVAFLLAVTCATVVPRSPAGGATAGLLALGAGDLALLLFRRRA